jgi:hypothetical protein
MKDQAMPHKPNEPIEPRITDDTDEVIAGLIYTVEYLDCFRMLAFDKEPVWDIALSYLETATDVAQDTLDVARERGRVRP